MKLLHHFYSTIGVGPSAVYCYAKLTCTGNGIDVEWKCNLLFVGIQTLKGKVPTVEWVADSGETTHLTDYPFPDLKHCIVK